MENKTFGERLRAAREVVGLSARRLARLASLGSNLEAIEKGARRPSDANLEALASVQELGVDLSTLLAWRNLDRAGGPEAIRAILRLLPEVAS